MHYIVQISHASSPANNRQDRKSMAHLVMGAMGSLIPKLYKLLEKEYKLQTSVKERISSLTEELKSAEAVLHKVAQVPWDQLDEQVQIWVRQVREASYDMEDILDIFLVHVQGSDFAEQESLLKRLREKMTNWWPKYKARRKTSCDVKDILGHLNEVTKRCRKYKVHDIVARTTTSTIDPRLHAMYTNVDKLVGIEKSCSELKIMLQLDDMSNMKMKTVSVVGIGGLGKTTLAKAVYNELKGNFDCGAFVPVGRTPDLQKVMQMILLALDKEKYQKFNFGVWQDITQFIDELREFLYDKRYFIVIDDIWDKQCWENLKLAIADDKNYEGRIIITTRKWEVAKRANEVYELPPHTYDNSRKLFYSRIYGDEVKYIDYEPDDVSDEILRKCAGVPLAIITMASILVDQPRERWSELYQSIGFGCKGNDDAENTMKKILSFSYYDLPLHLRACLLYLSAFPEDSVVPKVSLVWMWAAEGFIQKQNGKGWFEIGEGYFNDLVNRSLIQQVEQNNNNGIHGCCVHDMVLDFIRWMSHEENFFTVSDNNEQGTLIGRNAPRRVAFHNEVMLHSNQAGMFDMSKVRTFVAMDDVIDTWAPIFSFKLLRVLEIRCDVTMVYRQIQFEHLGHLQHLRFLGIHGMAFEKIPEEIGSLKMLQTLDLSESAIYGAKSSSSLPTQLVCLRAEFQFSANPDMFSVGRLTSLEQLSINFQNRSIHPMQFVKELGSLRELRVLDAHFQDLSSQVIESVCHLHKLQHLKISNFAYLFLEIETEFVLPGDLRTLVLYNVVLWKLPSCIDPLCHHWLYHMELSLLCIEEEELKTLGRFPELRFLSLDLQGAPATIRNISDSDACYFSKLRCLRLKRSLVLFAANKGNDGKKTVSFHIWDAKVDNSIIMPHSVSDAKQHGNDEFSSVIRWETSRGPVEEKSVDELQLLSVSADVPPVSGEESNEGSIPNREAEAAGERAATPRFMPSLQVLHFLVSGQAARHPRYCSNLGLEFLSSLREIRVDINRPLDGTDTSIEEVKAALRSTAQVHPNNPTLRIVKLTNDN